HLSIELALEEKVSLRQRAMIVARGTDGDLGHMDRARELGIIGERPPRGSARAGNTRNRGEINDRPRSRRCGVFHYRWSPAFRRRCKPMPIVRPPKGGTPASWIAGATTLNRSLMHLFVQRL